MIPKNVAFFREINKTTYSEFKKYLKKDYDIYYASSNIDIKGTLSKYNKQKNATDISKKEFEYSIDRETAYLAHKNIDKCFNIFYNSSKIIECTKKLLNSSDITNMYKRELLLKLKDIYKTELLIGAILDDYKNYDQVIIINDEKIYSDCIEFSVLENKSKIVNIIKQKTILKRISKKIKNILFLFIPLIIFLVKIKKIKIKRKKECFKLGIMVNHSKKLDSMNYYFIQSLIIDNKILGKNDVIFIDESGKNNVEYYENKGYNYTLINTGKEVVTFDLLKKIIKKFFPIWFKILLVSPFERDLTVKVSYNILRDYIKWNIFNDIYKVDNYVKATIPDRISKINILSQNKTRTWFIYPDNTISDIYLNWPENKKNNARLSYINYDDALIHGDLVKRHFLKNNNSIKNYHKVGVIFSEIVHEIRAGNLYSELDHVLRKKNIKNKKIIGAFDTSYTVDAPLKKHDGLKFGRDILKLLDDFSDIAIIFKAKKELKNTPFLNDTYNNLKNHERCLFIARYDKEGFSAPEVIAYSDLVISAAFTSTTCEALGAKTKAFYYDPSGKFTGEGFYYSNYPNFVAEDYEGLNKLVKYWLYEMSEKEFNSFLCENVKDEIDPYLDCKALTRFRKMLEE